jgi:hypothetical protein
MLEFHDDLKRIRYIKRLFRKYKDTGELKERLIINHLVVLYNTFDPTFDDTDAGFEVGRLFGLLKTVSYVIVILG